MARCPRLEYISSSAFNPEYRCKVTGLKMEMNNNSHKITLKNVCNVDDNYGEPFESCSIYIDSRR